MFALVSPRRGETVLSDPRVGGGRRIANDGALVLDRSPDDVDRSTLAAWGVK